MTPTEQDNELRDKLIKISEVSKPAWTNAAHFSVSKDGVATGFNIDELVNFITADRECVALEARIEAAEHIQNTMVHEAGGYCDEILPDAIPDYIAELKAQQEEV